MCDAQCRKPARAGVMAYCSIYTGAMTTQSHDDAAKAALLRRIRAENPELPDRHIARLCTLNITELMVSTCDVLTG